MLSRWVLRRHRSVLWAVVAAAALSSLGGCRTALPDTRLAGAYDYFATPAVGDAWSRKIRAWQDREREDPVAPAATSAGAPQAEADTSPQVSERPGLERESVGDLRLKYEAFRNERRRALAQQVAEWIQTQSRAHYVADGPVDHWATLEETLRTNGDDCDGLELLTYNFLRELGFPADEIFRAIVVRRDDGQHHMVTLWFEDERDPWVIDPTGAMTSGMPRMSDVPEWVPLRVFSHEDDFTVRDRMFLTAVH
jgi:predicted transglutaminase-like cysteine proteinase